MFGGRPSGPWLGSDSRLRYFSLDLPQFFGFAPTVAERTGFLLDSLGVVGIVS
jgi:hypothetical protein